MLLHKNNINKRLKSTSKPIKNTRNRNLTSKYGTKYLSYILVFAIAASIIFFLDPSAASLPSKIFGKKILVSNLASYLRQGNLSVNITNIQDESDNTQISESNSLNTMPTPKSKYCYVTLMSGIDESFKYRGFLYNVIIMRTSLISLGSKADFIVMIGFHSTIHNSTFFNYDRELLESYGIILYILPRFVDPSNKLVFAEMALQKISPFSFVQYKKVQFMDGDVMPIQNMDCLFLLNYNSFTVGAASPLNSGWYLAIPNITDYENLKEKAIWRLHRDWDKNTGWAEPFPQNTLYYRGSKKPVKTWDFNGANMDQGLFTHYFLFHRGNALLMDTETRIVKVFDQGYYTKPFKEVPLKNVLRSCDGIEPTSFFAHFTGRGKPWIKEEGRKISLNMKLWYERLDALQLNITSQSVIENGLGPPPLGYFDIHFPKGGFTKKNNN